MRIYQALSWALRQSAAGGATATATITASVALVFATAGCADRSAVSGDANAALADTLKSVISVAYDFSRPGVVERMKALYDANGSTVSASEGAVVASLDSIRNGLDSFWDRAGKNMIDPVWTWGPVMVRRLGNDAAVLTGKWSIPHIAPNNMPHVLEGAWTAVFVKTENGWKITHEHLSAPPAARATTADTLAS